MKAYHIFMGDVVASSTRDQVKLHSQLKELVKNTNKRLKTKILSPYTITLGDEFQGIAKSFSGVVETIFYLEEEILKKEYTFKLHYVAYWGEIATRINRNIAYQMMGPGLASARARLTTKRKTRPRFIFEYGDQAKNEILNGLFSVVESIVEHWKPRDFRLILDMIKSESDSEIASRRKKDRSLIWRRRGTLRVDEYAALKAALAKIADLFDASLRVQQNLKAADTSVKISA